MLSIESAQFGIMSTGKQWSNERNEWMNGKGNFWELTDPGAFFITHLDCLFLAQDLKMYTCLRND